MSSASLAKKRRANGLPTPPPPPPLTNNNTGPGDPRIINKAPLTLPQVLGILDSRIVKLENFAKETIQDKKNTPETLPTEIDDEYETRFELLATQIAEIKDHLLKLQTFTMEVNQTLFQEWALKTEESKMGSEDSKTMEDKEVEKKDTDALEELQTDG